MRAARELLATLRELGPMGLVLLLLALALAALLVLPSLAGLLTHPVP